MATLKEAADAIRAWRATPEVSRNAILKELEDTADEWDTSDDPNCIEDAATLRTGLQILRILTPRRS